MKSKKGTEGVIWMIVIITLLLVFLFIYGGVWNKLFGKSVKGIEEQIGATGDFDNDGVINLQDKCPCIIQDSIEYDGCNSNNPTDEQKKRDCLSKK